MLVTVFFGRSRWRQAQFTCFRPEALQARPTLGTFDAAKEEYGDMIVAVIDPAKVTLFSLQNASSIAAPDAYDGSHDC